MKGNVESSSPIISSSISRCQCKCQFHWLVRSCFGARVGLPSCGQSSKKKKKVGMKHLERSERSGRQRTWTVGDEPLPVRSCCLL